MTRTNKTVPSEAPISVFITPRFEGLDTGDGGIRRVVEAQRKWLPLVGVKVVDDIAKADVVAAHATAWPRTNVPVVSHCHGLYWAEYQWEKWCYAANRDVLECMRKADAVTSPSRWVRDAIARNTWIDSEVVYHGIDPSDWPAPTMGAEPNGGYVLWNKTRLDPICDVEPLNRLASMAPDTQFRTTFGATGPNVSVTGKLPYAAACNEIMGASVYLCTSRETFGIGTLEAMAAGVPVLGWAWGGQREIVTHGVEGWLATPGDYDGLLEGLRWCIAHRGEAGAVGRTKVLRDFTWLRAAKQYAELYQRVLTDRTSSVRTSVVVTCYNLGQYVEEAVHSAVEAGADEVVIVDDASPDGSGQVCEDVAAKRAKVRVLHNEHNEYLAGALNIGIGAAKGRYIVPLDADNTLAPNSVTVLADALDADLGLDIAYGAMQVIEPDGREWISPWPSDTFDFGAQLSHHNQIPSTCLYRKRVWQRVGGYRRRCRTAEDADFWCRATSYGARAKKVTDAVVLRYRDRADSMSHTVEDWPWNQWYPWHRDLKLAPPTSPVGGSIWTYEPPKVSVVIPVGPVPTHSKFVLDAIDSLVGQSMREWECIIVNDSGRPLPWIHPFCRVIDTGNVGGRGPAVARNLGFETARGRVVVPLDADDYLQPHALRILWDVWSRVGGYVYSDWIVQETGEVKTSEEYDCEAVLRHLPHAVTAAYGRAAWKEVGGFDEVTEAWEDWDFVIRLAAAGYCGTRVPVPLMQYRMRAGTVREAKYAEREKHKSWIRRTWGEYISGGKKLMACGGCPKGGGVQLPPVSSEGIVPERNGAANGDAVLLEYVGRVSGPIVFRGQSSGTTYRFGLDPHHKLKYVLKGDAEGASGFLSRNDFELAKRTVDVPTLQAAGV